MPLARGFSLPEVLITMAISSVLMMGTVKLLPSLQLGVLRQTQRTLMQEDLWQIVLTLGKHLQRAGYCAGACAGEGITISSNGQCVIARWDANSNGKWESAASSEPEQTGFRLRDGVIETLRGANSCSGSGWEKLSEATLFRVTQFQINERRQKGYAPRFAIEVDAIPAQHSAGVFTVTHQVTGYNLP